MEKKLINYHDKLKIKSIAKNNIIISGYASVFGVVDGHNEIVLPGAFAGLDKRLIKFLWQHDQKKPIGIVSYAKEDDYGLYVECEINLSINLGREAMSLLEQGALDGLSIGFIAKNTRYNADGQREIITADLHEVSLVTFPANQNAQVIKIESALSAVQKALFKLKNTI
jgi:HK97 family phage prohead protease